MYFFKRRAVLIIAFFFIVLSCLVVGQMIHCSNLHLKYFILGVSISLIIITTCFFVRSYNKTLKRFINGRQKIEKQADYISELENTISYLEHELSTYSIRSIEDRRAYDEQIEKLKALQDKNNQLIEKNNQLNEKNNLRYKKICELEEESGKKGALCHELIHRVRASGILDEIDSKDLKWLNCWLQVARTNHTADELRESLFSGFLGKD